MASTGLNVTLSSLSQASAGRARNPDRLARLQALDKNGDGQLDLDEVCDAIEKIIRKEKTERTLKWLLAALAVFSLLTIAATVGLTYAVVALSKDTKVNGDVLQSKDSGGAMRTGSFLQSQNVSALVAAVEASDDPDAVLGRINSIKVPSLKIGEAYTVYKVDAVTMMMNRSVLVKTSTGLDILMPVESIEQRPDFWSLLNITKARQSSESGRKLLAVDTSACFKVSQIWGFCYRLFCEFGDDKTIDDIINAWNNPDKTCNTHLPSVQSLPAPPMLQALDPSTIKLKIDVEKSATYDRSATLGSIKSQIKNPQNNGLYDNGFWLFLDSRHVTMRLCLVGTDCNTDPLGELNGWFPIDDVFGNVNAVVVSYFKSFQIVINVPVLVKNGMSNTAANKLGDTDKISTYCTSPDYLQLGNCIVDVFLDAVPQL